MANIFWPNKPAENQIIEFVADASLAIDIGDLLYHDTNDAKPASSQADQGTEALNQRYFAARFAGVATSARRSTDTVAGVVRARSDGLHQFTCVSATYEIGDLVGPSENGDGDALLDQQVEKVTTIDLAIGVAVERKASATTAIWCRLLSRYDSLLRSGALPEFPLSNQGAVTAKTTAVTLTIAELLTRILTGTHAAGATAAYTLPTGTLMSAGLPFLADGGSFDWSLLNLSAAAADTITLTAGTDHTIVGNPIVQSAHSSTGGVMGNSAMWRSRKSTGNTWITYRIA
jgi:hypothetical protein